MTYIDGLYIKAITIAMAFIVMADVAMAYTAMAYIGTTSGPKARFVGLSNSDFSAKSTKRCQIVFFFEACAYCLWYVRTKNTKMTIAPLSFRVWGQTSRRFVYQSFTRNR